MRSTHFVSAAVRDKRSGRSSIQFREYPHQYRDQRCQDAITGRFLSPDPTVPDPGNTQSYNRYSYVNNNPVTMVDPSGFESDNPTDVESYNGLAPGAAPSGSTSDGTLPQIVVTSTPPGTTATQINPGGYVMLSPSGDIVQYVGFASGGSGSGSSAAAPAAAAVAAAPSKAPVVVPAKAQSQKPAAPKLPPPPPPPCYASRLNNPNAASNGRIGFIAGTTIATGGTLIFLNIVGFPEVEAAEGALSAGYVLGLASGVGDAPLVAVSAGAYGALGGTAIGVGATTPMCSGQSSASTGP